MLTLFNGYKEDGKMSLANLIGRNLFNRYPANNEVFEAYFTFLCSLAESLPMLNERQDFAGQARVVLAFFSENADLDEATLARIVEYQQQLFKILNTIASSEQERIEHDRSEIANKNSESLKTLYKLKDSLYSANNQEKFDMVLAKIGATDAAIEKANLSETQSANYNSLIKSCTEVISEKMREFEYKKNVAYNKKAIDSYSKAFEKFKKNEGKYKTQTQLFSLASSTLFAYDASRLFNETLIYYNHVYSYIFSKLDDNGKLTLTRFSIECERNLR